MDGEVMMNDYDDGGGGGSDDDSDGGFNDPGCARRRLTSALPDLVVWDF